MKKTSIATRVRFFSFLFFASSFLILLRVFFLSSYPDFGQYYFGLNEMFTSNPYLQVGKAFTSTTYPPLTLILFSPFSLLPLIPAEKIWTGLSLSFLFLSVFLIFKIYKKNIFSTLGFIILGLVCLSFPVKFTLGMGQVNNFVLLLAVLGVYFLNSKKQISAGISLAFSLTIKFFPIFFPLYLILVRKWKALVTLVIGVVLLYLIAFLLNPKINIYFYTNVFPTLFGGWKTDYYNQSLTGFLGRIFLQGQLREILRIAVSIVLALVSFFAILKTYKTITLQNMHLGLLISLNLLINNFSWQHHFVLMLFPFLTTLFFITDKKLSHKYLIILFISYLLIAFNLKNPNDFPVLIQSHVFYGALLLWFLEAFLILKGSLRLRLNSSSTSKR